MIAQRTCEQGMHRGVNEAQVGTDMYDGPHLILNLAANGRGRCKPETRLLLLGPANEGVNSVSQCRSRVVWARCDWWASSVMGQDDDAYGTSAPQLGFLCVRELLS
jgi:hypothetical protein